MPSVPIPLEFWEETYYAGEQRLKQLRLDVGAKAMAGVTETDIVRSMAEEGWSPAFASWYAHRAVTRGMADFDARVQPAGALYRDYDDGLSNLKRRLTDRRIGWIEGVGGNVAFYLGPLAGAPGLLVALTGIGIHFHGAYRVARSKGYATTAFWAWLFGPLFWVWIALAPDKCPPVPDPPHGIPRDPPPIPADGSIPIRSLPVTVPFEQAHRWRQIAPQTLSDLVTDSTAALVAGKSPEAVQRAMLKAEFDPDLAAWFPQAMAEHLARSSPPKTEEPTPADPPTPPDESPGPTDAPEPVQPPEPSPATSPSSVQEQVEYLERLAVLLANGSITQDEFDATKRRLLAG